jgi:serine/threonine protein kinase
MVDQHASLTVSRSALGRLEQLGKGGTAIVYRAPDFSVAGADVTVYKEYKQSTRAYAGPSLLPGLLSLVRFREKLAPPQRQLWDERIVWPLRVVTNDEGGASGILMRLIPSRFFQLTVSRTGGQSTHPREVEKLFGSAADMARIGIPEVELTTRLAIVGQIAATYAMMHRAGVVVGDISGRNIVYDPAGNRPQVLAVDADSARVEGTRSAFSNQPHTPHWEPPEALQAARALRHAKRGAVDAGTTGDLGRLSNTTVVQSKATDVYKFGLLVVRILDFGRQRSVNRDPGKAVTVLRRWLGREAGELLTRTLSADPAQRPELREWYLLTHPGAARRATGTPPRRPVPAPPAIADGQVNGAWVYVEGTGWVRRPQAAGGGG